MCRPTSCLRYWAKISKSAQHLATPTPDVMVCMVMIAHVQCCNGNQVPTQQSFTTFSTLQHFYSHLLADFPWETSKPDQQLGNVWLSSDPPRDVGWQIYWWIGIAWVPNKLINTWSTFVEVPAALLQPCVGRHLASDILGQNFQISPTFGHTNPCCDGLWWW